MGTSRITTSLENIVGPAWAEMAVSGEMETCTKGLFTKLLRIMDYSYRFKKE